MINGGAYAKQSIGKTTNGYSNMRCTNGDVPNVLPSRNSSPPNVPGRCNRRDAGVFRSYQDERSK
jgi:hypothetical protein